MTVKNKVLVSWWECLTPPNLPDVIWGHQQDASGALSRADPSSKQIFVEAGSNKSLAWKWGKATQQRPSLEIRPNRFI